MPAVEPDGAPLVATDRDDLAAYGLFAALCLLTAAPFALASADGAVAGIGAVPSPRVWDAVGRATALIAEGPWPPTPGYGPFSPLWTWLLALPYGLLAWTGLSSLGVAKVFGWACGVATGVAVYNLAFAVSGRRWPGVLALVLLALDPAVATGRVAASEAPLVAALALFVALAVAQGQHRWLPWLLAGLVLVRPDGVVFAGLAVLVLVVDRLWCGGEVATHASRELVGIGRLCVPALVALAAWALYGLVVAGSPLPPLWAPDGAAPHSRTGLSGLWGGQLAVHPTFASGFVVVAVLAWAWTAWLFGRTWGPRGALAALTPLAVLASVAVGGPPPGAVWSYDARRLVEPALPWLALSLALALAAAGAFIWRRSAAGTPPSLHAWPLERAIACLPLVFWSLSAILAWVAAVQDYAWGARDVSDLPLAAGHWLAQNAPVGARVSAAPGVDPVRAVDRRPTREIWGDATGSWLAARQAAQDEGLAYLAAYRGTPPATWPMAREVLRLSTSHNVALPTPELAVYRLDWSLPRLEKRNPVLVDASGYAVLDELDVADDASETRHFYTSSSRTPSVRTESAAPNGWLVDEGRPQELGRGTESFTVAAKPGQDLVLGVRYGAGSRGALRFDVDGDSSQLQLRDCGYELCEDAAVVMPSGHAKKPSVRVDVAFVGGGGRATTYHYWTLARG
jgi:hypothetical protein